MNWRVFFLLLSFIFIGTAFNRDTACSHIKPENMDFEVLIPEAEMKQLKMIGYVDRFGVNGKNSTEKLYGKILRSLRFQNITREVEQKYNLPKNLLLAMVMHESSGADLLPNGQDDGGLGLCHMQGSTASKFGLRTYQGCSKLVCKTHGHAFRHLIKKEKYDRKRLIQYDDRFHPILNLDAAGRMLNCYKSPQVRGLPNEWATAIYRYAGRYNYRKYWQRVKYYQKALNDPEIIKAVEKEFNRRNPSFTIDGVQADFDAYIQAHQMQNINYGLENY